MADQEGGFGAVLVTGCAGFIGSTLAEAVLGTGVRVVGIDAVTDSYGTDAKRANLAALREHSGFELHEVDLLDAALPSLLEGIEVVFHLAGLPGVRTSWGERFADYERTNVLATQHLLEALRRTPVRRLVYSSSSSVYGQAERYPVRETDLPAPLSPYGVTKLAAEHLCNLYAANFAVPAVSLRYFTVYGPRQRPDMAIHRLVEAALSGAQFQVFGTGEQRRDFTFVDDAVSANLLAARAELEPGTVLNIGGGSDSSLNEIITLVESATDRPMNRVDVDGSPGDPFRTGADVSRARELLGWIPTTSMAAGIAAQVAWHRRSSLTIPT
jgi:nucleoside-diphosphate-sugar epimerase